MAGNEHVSNEKTQISNVGDDEKNVPEIHGEQKTLKDIAVMAGVSAMTVSNVLRPRKNRKSLPYSKETAARVLQMAQQLGYVPNRAARAMRTRETGVVGFVSANFSNTDGKVANFGVHPLLVGLNHVLSPSGRHVVLVEMNELEFEKSQELPPALRERFFDGLVLHYGVSTHAVHLLEKQNVPLISWDSGTFDKVNCVYRDEFEAGRVPTQRLCELGHKRIAFAVSRSAWSTYKSGNSVHFSLTERYRGYLAAINANRLKEFIVQGYFEKELTEQLEQTKVTAAITQGGFFPILRAAARLGIQIPEDLSVLSCDLETSIADRGDTPGGSGYNRYNAGRIVGDLLLKRLESNGADVPSVCLPIEYIEGTTAGPAPDASRTANNR